MPLEGFLWDKSDHKKLVNGTCYYVVRAVEKHLELGVATITNYAKRRRWHDDPSMMVQLGKTDLLQWPALANTLDPSVSRAWVMTRDALGKYLKRFEVEEQKEEVYEAARAMGAAQAKRQRNEHQDAIQLCAFSMTAEEWDSFVKTVNGLRAQPVHQVQVVRKKPKVVNP